MLTRRLLIGAALGGFGAALAARPGAAAALLPAGAGSGGLLRDAGLRGGFDDSSHVVMPQSGMDETRRFQRVLRQAADKGRPVFLPPGTYRVSSLDLPDNTEINGIAGSSRIEYTGEGSLFTATGARRIRIAGVTIDGGNRWLSDGAGGLLHFISVPRVEIEGCEIIGASRNAIHLEGCGGEIRQNRISGAADAGIYAVESAGLAVRDNTLSGCGNGGILIHRYRPAADGTVVTGNRISGTLARSGGTGQNGNGINIFRASNVMVANNHVDGSAFSAIRANAASGIQISANQCLSSGETAIYSEFGFEGAVVSANVIDGAANGISAVNFNEGGRLAAITGNMLRNITAPGPYPALDAGFGLGITAEADAVISGNVIDTAAKWGLLLGWGPYLRNVVATGNMVRAVPVGCAVSVAQGAGSALVADNSFSETPGGAVAGFAWNEKKTGDLALAMGSGFDHLTVERNRVS